MKYCQPQPLTKSISLTTYLLKRFSSSYFYIQNSIRGSFLPTTFYHQVGSKVSCTDENSQPETYHAFCRRKILLVVSYILSEIIKSHLILLKNCSHIYRYKSRWQCRKRNGLIMFSIACETFCQACLPLYHNKE